MDISQLTTREKGAILARLMGWHVDNLRLEANAWKRVIVDAGGNDLGLKPVGGGVRPVETELRPEMIPDLYQLQNLHLARMVFIWVICTLTMDEKLEAFMDEAEEWLKENAYYLLYDSTGFTRGLDRVLKLAITAGLVETPAVTQEARP